MKETLKEELDFIHEGHNGERCADELKHLSYVYVPEIHWDLTTKVGHKYLLYYVPFFFLSCTFFFLSIS